MKYRYLVIVCFIAFLVFPKAMSNVRLNGLFTDHMVIQRNTKIPVWGWADPSEKITVKTSWGEKVKTKAAKDSTWQVMIQTPKAGGPYTIWVAGKNKIELNDVLSGEVWLCTGQSNMDFEMYRFLNDAREKKFQPWVEACRKEVATANDPWIRHLEVPRTPSMHQERKDLKANWRMAVTGQIDTITAVGYFFAKELRKHLDVPVGLLECAWGGSRIQPWISEEDYMNDETMKAYYVNEKTRLEALIEEMNTPGWEDTEFQKKQKLWKSDKTKYSRAWPTEHPEKSKQTPATIHNGMLAPIIPFAVKGVLWYQGESNSHFLEEQYEAYFKTMIQSWRQAWGQQDMPFYWWQLAAYHVSDKRSDMGWAMVNDQLRRTMELPHTGMAVLYDIGEPADVHPHNKMDAGRRLALWALKNDYGVNIPEVSGPLYAEHEIKGNKIEIRFEHVGKGLMAGYKPLFGKTVELDVPLTWFEIAGSDKKWIVARAKIVSQNKIVVYHPDVKQPVHVRYAWSSNPDGANLYNKNGLPAAVFSTDASIYKK